MILTLPQAQRARVDGILNLQMRCEQSPNGPLVPLRELVRIQNTKTDKNLYHKNLMPVIYVIGDVAGGNPAGVLTSLTCLYIGAQFPTDACRGHLWPSHNAQVTMAYCDGHVGGFRPGADHFGITATGPNRFYWAAGDIP